MSRGTSSLLLFALPLVVGCGGSVVFDEAGGQGGGGGGLAAGTTISGGNTTSGPNTATADASASVADVSASASVADVSASTGPSATSATSASSASVTTGPGPCESHDDCPGALCVFATGQCAVACSAFSCDACTAGEVCDDCATSSCPQCEDCIAACQPTPPGRCDDDDPCAGPDEVCLFQLGICAPSCDSASCADPNMVCNGCVTGSCCGCDDCVSACQPVGGPWRAVEGP